jgi:ankyrin repeat protein
MGIENSPVVTLLLEEVAKDRIIYATNPDIIRRYDFLRGIAIVLSTTVGAQSLLLLFLEEIREQLGVETRSTLDELNAALLCAANEGHRQCVEAILEVMMRPKQAKSTNSYNFLLSAPRDKFFHSANKLWLEGETPKAFLKGGYPPFTSMRAKGSPLVAAAAKNYFEIVHKLCESECYVSEVLENPELYIRLLEESHFQHNNSGRALGYVLGKVDERQNRQDLLAYGLFFLARELVERNSLIQLLLRKGADPNFIPHDSGATTVFRPPIIVAADEGKLRLVELLLNAGADPNITHRGTTPLLAAICSTDRRYWRTDDRPKSDVLAMVKLLLAYNADPRKAPVVSPPHSSFLGQVRLDYGNALIAAAACGTIEIIGALLEAGALADLNCFVEADQCGTPLIAAVERGDLGIVRYLLDHGADCSLEAHANSERYCIAAVTAAMCQKTSLFCSLLTETIIAYQRSNGHGKTPWYTLSLEREKASL